MRLTRRPSGGTAAYYHAFKDATGVALDGDNSAGYVLTFSAGQIPQAKRFWSVTSGRFNAMLRVYGPEGSVAANTYVPPAIQRN
jgi:hypothetical protein